MIEKYKSEILRSYEQKKDAGALSTNLMCLTPAKIRDEFYSLLSLGCDNTDLRMVREFFKIPFEKELSDIPYKKWDLDKLKPLITFLKTDNNTNYKNVEMLAWLIDFRPRPYSNYWRLSKGKTRPLSELAITESGIVEASNNEQLNRCQLRQPSHEAPYENAANGKSKLKQWKEKNTEVAEYSNVLTNEKNRKKEVTLEYPSGVKLSVDASNLSLIAQLIRL